jgi:hypothetical protein
MAGEKEDEAAGWAFHVIVNPKIFTETPGSFPLTAPTRPVTYHKKDVANYEQTDGVATKKELKTCHGRLRL